MRVRLNTMCMPSYELYRSKLKFDNCNIPFQSNVYLINININVCFLVSICDATESGESLTLWAFKLYLNFIYFTTITIQVIQLILTTLVGTDVCFLMVFLCKETGIPEGNPLVWLGDHMTISHADAGYWTRVAAVRGERVTTTPARQPGVNYFRQY